MSDQNNAPVVVENTASWGPTALDKEAEKMIQEISDEFKYADPPEAPQERVETAPVSPTEQQNSVPAPESPPETPKPAQKPDEWGLERVISAQLDLRREKEAFEAEKKAWAESRTQEGLDLELNSNATQALRSRGIDPEQLVRRIIAEKMGDRAPEELKHAVAESDKDARYMRELQELKATLQAERAMRAGQEFVSRVQNGAREYVTTGIKSEQFPTLTRIAQANPDRAHQEIMKEISQDAAARAHREPNGEPLPYEEAARRVEARVKDLASIFTTGPTSAASTPPVQGSPNPPNHPKTQADGKSPPNPSTPGGVPKPPDRPLAPWLVPVDIEEEGIKAAVAEYRKLEGR